MVTHDLRAAQRSSRILKLHNGAILDDRRAVDVAAQ